MAKEKSLEELRAAIEQDQQDNQDTDTDVDTGTQVEAKSNEEDASDEEGTSIEASDNTQEEAPKEEEWVVPGRFKTNEDVLKAYKELESFTGKQSSEIQKLRTAISEPPRRGETPEEKAIRLKRFADELANDPMEAIRGLYKEDIKQVTVANKANEFKRVYDSRMNDSNSDFAELEPIMSQIAVQYGDMIMAEGLQNDPRLLDILHMAARGIKANEIARKAESKGVEKGQKVARQKKQAKIEGSSSTTTTKKPDISKLSAAQMKALMEKGDIDMSE